MKSMFDPAAAGPGMPRLRPAAATLIALHCSGASGDMWQPLRDRMGVGSRMLAPDLHGARNGPAWHGNRAFTLEDEAAPVVALIDAERRPVHLVGHSYGGAVALQVALARPAAVAGITLYEPSAFHLLGADDGAARAEIVDLAAEVGARLGRGDARGAMARFVTYWGGRDSWDGLRPDIQSRADALGAEGDARLSCLAGSAASAEALRAAGRAVPHPVRRSVARAGPRHRADTGGADARLQDRDREGCRAYGPAHPQVPRRRRRYPACRRRFPSPVKAVPALDPGSPATRQ